jgi:hypothetical protein
VYLRENGASVTDVEDPERAAFRATNGIPDTAASCHTALIDTYAIEGHVPAGAIRRLLDDRPDIVGLALPGMPADSPGMGGDPMSWQRQAVLAIALDGTASSFTY